MPVPSTLERAANASPLSATEPVVQRAREGDRHAFEELYRRHRDEIFRHAMRMLGEEQAALDATQEAFARAISAMARTRGELLFRPWLFRIATNLCLKQLRRRRRVQPDAQPSQLPSCSTDPERSERDRQLAQRVDDALGRLPPRYRQLLILRELDGLSYGELAEVVGSRIGSLKVVLHRARKRLYSEVRARELLVDPASREGLRCESLVSLLADVPTHRQLVRHLEGCSSCAEEKSRAWLALLPPCGPPASWPDPSSSSAATPTTHGTWVLWGIVASALLLAGGLLMAHLATQGVPAPVGEHPDLRPRVGAPNPTVIPHHALRGEGKPGPGLTPVAASKEQARRSSPLVTGTRWKTIPGAMARAGKGPLAIRTQPALKYIMVRRSGRRVALAHAKHLRQGDALGGRSFGLRFAGHQWVAVQGRVELEHVPPKRPAPNKLASPKGPRRQPRRGPIALRLVRGSLQGRATKKGRGLYIAAGACRVFVAQGTFRLRRVGGLLHVDSLSARMTIDGQALFPGFGRVVGVARFSLESLLPAPLELRPTSYDGHTMPTLSWNAVEGATTYRVRVARDADFIEIVKQAKTTATHTRALRLRAGNYFWQVVAERLGRWGHPSKIYSLRIRSKPQRL